ncbi:MAG: GIY-YIG nuclease family protein [Cyanobium sp.]
MTAPQARQGDLFAASSPATGASPGPLPPPLLRQQLLRWQERLLAHQAPLFARAAAGPAATVAAAASQGQLFAAAAGATGEAAALELAANLNPLELRAQSLAFWRWPSAPQQGAAIYLVIDRPSDAPSPLLLYVGETGCADRRWKGDHDCKGYLAAYSEALGRAELSTSLSIRFWCDVPGDSQGRRRLEQTLIRLWLPPFNKETRERWATPFTADPS